MPISGVCPDLLRQRNARAIENKAAIVLHVDDEGIHFGPLGNLDQSFELAAECGPTVHVKSAQGVGCGNVGYWLPGLFTSHCGRGRGFPRGAFHTTGLRVGIAVLLASERRHDQRDGSHSYCLHHKCCRAIRRAVWRRQRAFSSALASERYPISRTTVCACCVTMVRPVGCALSPPVRKRT